MTGDIHERFMRKAIAEARKGLGLTTPNPAVGAVLVSGNRVIARGYHRHAGADHAEIDCLSKISDPISPGSTLYVTLEPCSTRGRTAPCADYIIKRGVHRVVIGAVDPNPKHCGRAIELLREAGIDVTVGILEAECTQLNEAFNKWIVTGEPFVIAKCGMSLDGRLTAPLGESRWITSAQSRRDAQELRALVDAILVGAETIRRDNPRLTARTASARKQPRRVIVTRSGRLPRRANIFQDGHSSRTMVYRNRSLRAVLQDLGRQEITSVLIEGGGEILSQALDQRLIDKIQIYIGAQFNGGAVFAFGGTGTGTFAESLRIDSPQYEQIGNDVRITGYPKTTTIIPTPTQ
jgi:diaminohydroxyphosphoribosylaminopyrimidine deaminase/5-amino-6-(5-phosphoribosylamino)uracil reductase